LNVADGSTAVGQTAGQRRFDGAAKPAHAQTHSTKALPIRFQPLNAANDSNAPIADLFAALDLRPATPRETLIAHRCARPSGLLRSQSGLVAEMHGKRALQRFRASHRKISWDGVAAMLSQLRATTVLLTVLSSGREVSIQHWRASQP